MKTKLKATTFEKFGGSFELFFFTQPKGANYFHSDTIVNKNALEKLEREKTPISVFICITSTL
jgi:hypothetical protein